MLLFWILSECTGCHLLDVILTGVSDLIFWLNLVSYIYYIKGLNIDNLWLFDFMTVFILNACPSHESEMS